MKQLIVNVPDSKYPFFQELIQALGYEVYSEESPLSTGMEAAIDVELKRIAANPAYLQDWQEARKTLKRSGDA